MISTQDYFKISRELDHHYSIFYAMWRIGYPKFDNDIPTAAVYFDKDGECIDYHFNQDFWNQCDDYKRKFVICHECLHVVFDHGKRSKDLWLEDSKLINIVMDIVVNESLVKFFGFDRELIKDWQNLIWYDTVFTDKTIHVEKDQSFEYYYNLLKQNVSKINGGASLLDSHDHFKDCETSDFIKSKITDALENDPSVSNEALDLLKKLICRQAGVTAGNTYKIMPKNTILKKKKWETVIKKWVQKSSALFDITEKWTHPNKRISHITDKCILPGIIYDNTHIKNKMNLWFFQDTSGSCVHLAERFFKAAMSIPTQHFNIQLYCFDTKVYKIDPKTRKLSGFGGTSFSCIEDYIQEQVRKKSCKYPDAIWIITDGAGNPVNPQIPKNWYWFLTDNYTYYIPKTSNIYQLADFE